MDNNLFLKINYRINKNELHQSVMLDRYDIDVNTNYDRKTENSSHVLGGGFYKKDSATFVFKVKDIEEAQKLMKSNPLIKNKKYRFELLNYNLFKIKERFSN